jgi:hypothetical protein
MTLFSVKKFRDIQIYRRLVTLTSRAPPRKEFPKYQDLPGQGPQGLNERLSFFPNRQLTRY